MEARHATDTIHTSSGHFGVKYINKDDAHHLQQVLEEHYKITMDWDGRRYIGITLDWDYKQRKVHLSMPGYIKAALLQFAIPAQTTQKATVALPINQYNMAQKHSTQQETQRILNTEIVVEMLRQEQDRHTAKSA